LPLWVEFCTGLKIGTTYIIYYIKYISIGLFMDFDGLVSGFRNRVVFVVGDVMVDKFVYGRVSRVSPEAPVPVVEVVVETDVLGGAANVVSVLSMTAAKVFVSGVVGSDDSGRELKEKLKRNKIDLRGIVVDRSRPTTLKTRVVAHNQQVVRVDRESRGEIGRGIVDKIVKYFSTVVDRVDGVVVSDYCKGSVTSDVVEKIVGIARKHGKIVVANTKAENILHYKGVDVLVVNLDEACTASGIRPINETSIKNMGNKILSMVGCRNVVITRGKEGFSVFGLNGFLGNVKSPDFGGSYEFRKTDDTALSFLALGLLSGLNILDAARFSCYVVEVLVGKKGAQRLTLEDISEALAAKPLD